jgi:peptide/nickel transport system substrate-binding protein
MSATLPYLVFNTVSPRNEGALRDPAVRRALSHGIRREALVQVLGGPVLNPPLTRVLPSTVVGGEHGFDLYPHDPERARALLAQAGHPTLTLRFLYSNQILGSRKIFQALKQDLAGIGVTVEGVFVTDADFHEAIEASPDAARRGDWDLSLGRWLSDWSGNAAVSFFRPLFRSDSVPPRGYNSGLYASPATDRLIDRATLAATEEEAAALWEETDRAVMSDAAVYPITNPRLPNYHAAHVHNAVFLQDFLQYDPTNVWLSRDQQGG